MVLAVEAGHRNSKKEVIKWLFWTVIGGAFFVGSQAWEWYHFIHGSHGGAMLASEVTLSEEEAAMYGGEWMTIAIKGDAHVDAHHGEEIKLEHVDNLYVINTASKIYADQASFDSHGTDRDVMNPALVEKLVANKERHIFGANMTENEYSPEQPQFANFFFFITGFHGFHVFSGVIINLIILIMVVKGVMHKRGHYEMVEKTGLYWHFVDLVWVFVFTFFYLV